MGLIKLKEHFNLQTVGEKTWTKNFYFFHQITYMGDCYIANGLCRYAICLIVSGPVWMILKHRSKASLLEGSRHPPFKEVKLADSWCLLQSMKNNHRVCKQTEVIYFQFDYFCWKLILWILSLTPLNLV